jgi:hypothetical protein
MGAWHQERLADWPLVIIFDFDLMPEVSQSGQGLERRYWTELRIVVNAVQVDMINESEGRRLSALQAIEKAIIVEGLL